MNKLNKNRILLKSNNINKHILATNELLITEDEKIFDQNSFYYIGLIEENKLYEAKNNLKDIFIPIKKGKYFHYYKKINNDNNILITQYILENKNIFLFQNFLNSKKILTMYRWDKIEKKFLKLEIPEEFKKYYDLMKGININQKLIYNIRLRQKTNKLWKKILFNLFEISLVNSFILYKKVTNDKNITQKNFRLEILKAIINKYSLKPPKAYHMRKNNNVCAGKHLITKSKHRACIFCRMTKKIEYPKIPVTPYCCLECKVNLCVECFGKYHKMKFINYFQ